MLLISFAYATRSPPQQEQTAKLLTFAHFFVLDHLLSTLYTVLFAVVWWVYTPHDGARVSNSAAQAAMVALAKSRNEIGGDDLTVEERTRIALGMWEGEKLFAVLVLLACWVLKVGRSSSSRLGKGGGGGGTRDPRSALSLTRVPPTHPCADIVRSCNHRSISPSFSIPSPHISGTTRTVPFLSRPPQPEAAPGRTLAAPQSRSSTILVEEALSMARASLSGTVRRRTGRRAGRAGRVAGAGGRARSEEERTTTFLWDTTLGNDDDEIDALLLTHKT